MKKYLQLIGIFLCILVGFVVFSFVYTSDDRGTTAPQTQSGQLTLSGVTDKVVSRVQRILDDVEVQNTLERIEKDAPRYNKDGATFVNLERHLPVQKDRNYYSEWTVRTPGESDRGARRIIEGKGGELYFTDDHYSSFTRIR